MAKHEKTFVDLDKPYEQNLIGLKGIIIFAVGLFLLCVITFGLMYVLLNLMESNAASADAKNKSPLQLTEKEQLPPEPRLQSAPGFGVRSMENNKDGQEGWINLELRNPAAEYDELHKQWEKEWKEGQKDPKTGTVITLSIDEAKKKMLESIKAPATEDGQKLLDEARSVVSYSSAGRVASDKRR